MKKKKAKNKKIKQKGLIIFFLIFCVLVILSIIGFFKADNAMEKIVHTNKEVTVPDITGLKFDEAKEKLEKEGLIIEKSLEVSDRKIKKGRVVSQFPLQNSIVREGRIIRVVLSSGGTGAEMPNVIGIDQREAEAILKNAGCIIGQEEFLYSSSVPQGKVIAQSPEPLSIISRGVLVNLKISTGLPPRGIKLMPSILGLRKDVVEILLSTIGLNCNFEFVPTDNKELKGVAIEQSPSVDDEITEGQIVNIKIGK